MLLSIEVSPALSIHDIVEAQVRDLEVRGGAVGAPETGRWLLSEERTLRDISCCVIYDEHIEVSATSSN